MSGSSVFLIGPGFIGGEILGHLLKEKYEVTTLIRRESAAAAFNNVGVKTVLGTLDDRHIIKEQVALSDIVFHTATSDHLPSAEAVIAGIEHRAASGQQTIYIHTSGASLFADDSAGDHPSEKVFDDEKPKDIDALPDSAPHRLIDLAILGGTNPLGNLVKLAIMIPPVVYGVGSRDNRLSIQYPTMVRYSLKHGYAGHIGKGLAVWNQIHVKDLARGYMRVLHWLESSSPEETHANPYWLCENGQELSWGEVAAEIGRSLHKAGRLPSSNTKTIPRSNYKDMFGDEWTDASAGCNARHRANRLRKLGWKPQEKKTLESLVEDEIPLILQETEAFNGYSTGVINNT
ncbi:Fc.00g024950.m01.CDS01 [Cosmosporella sp. VM-42]